MITEKINILIVEDNIDHYRIIKYHIKKIVKTPEISFVDSFDKLKKHLDKNTPDLILSDYKMNSFNGLDVFKYVKENTAISNFVFITSTIHDEDLASNTILNCATGFILKKHMNSLQEKLKPFLVKIIKDRKLSELPPRHRETIDGMRLLIKSANDYNKVHVESYNEIKKTLEKMNKKKKQ